MLRFPDDCQHISYLMIKFNAVDFTKEYIEMEEKYRLDYNYQNVYIKLCPCSLDGQALASKPKPGGIVTTPGAP